MPLLRHYHATARLREFRSTGQAQLQELAEVAGVEGESLSAELHAAARSDGATRLAAEVVRQ